jgi:putative oxidoreductase
MKIFKTIVFSLFALLLINGGLDKLIHYMPQPESLPEELMKDNAAFAEIVWLMPLVGVAELLGGLLILIPKTRALGVLIIFPVMVGMLLTHLTVAQFGLPIALVVWAILIWLIADNFKKYQALLG